MVWVDLISTKEATSFLVYGFLLRMQLTLLRVLVLVLLLLSRQVQMLKKGNGRQVDKGLDQGGPALFSIPRRTYLVKGPIFYRLQVQLLKLS